MNKVPGIPSEFPERTPMCEEEERLIHLQSLSDELGLIAYSQVLESRFETEEQQRMLEIGKIATQELIKLVGAAVPHKRSARLVKNLADLIDPNPKNKFYARYIYDTDTGDTETHAARLVYPIDSLHWAAYIEGTFMGARQLALEHPSIDRNGQTGYRLCAELKASRVMGLHTPDKKPSLTIYAPIGEITTHEVPYEQGAPEALEPRA